MKDSQCFFLGTNTYRCVEIFGLRRTGRHYLWSCLTGLYDLITPPEQIIDNSETAITGYAMQLREGNAPYRPVRVNQRVLLNQELPKLGKWPVIFLIRDPLHTLYSLYHVAPNGWDMHVTDQRDWIYQHANYFFNFYDAALKICKEQPMRAIWVSYEKIFNEVAELERIIDFVGQTPKLSPKFVHRYAQLELMITPGRRTYSQANNTTSWMNDEEWMTAIQQVKLPDFSKLGYKTPENILIKKKNISW